MPRDRFDLDSSWIAGADYDSDTRTLNVRLKSGRTYTSEGVPPEVVDGLKNDPSPGTFYRDRIKGVY